MVFMNYYDLAIARKSVRSFTAKKISDKTRSEIEDYGNRCECLTPGTAVEWRYFEGTFWNSSPAARAITALWWKRLTTWSC